MKPLTRYAPALEGGGPYAADYATMLEDERGSYYAKDEADARFAELTGHAEVWAAVAKVRADRIAELEAEVARLREDAERYRWLKENAADSHMWGDATIDAARAKK